MNKEKEIEELIKITQRHMETLCETPCDEAVFRDMMRTLTYAGYRKAEEVRKETAKDILQELYPYIGHWLTFKALKEKYGVEVEE